MTSRNMREVIHDDAINWLKHQKSLPNVVTGICDMEEMNETDADKYLQFFSTVAALIFSKLDPYGYAIFIQTDRKYQRALIDKSHILSTIAYENGMKIIWHKIVLHRDVNSTNLHRPTYAHMLCYSKLGSTGAAFPDVIPVSYALYKNGTPVEAAVRAVKFIKDNNKHDTTIIDPFVGRGTILAVANNLGLRAVGIDIDQDQVSRAKQCTI